MNNKILNPSKKGEKLINEKSQEKAIINAENTNAELIDGPQKYNGEIRK